MTALIVVESMFGNTRKIADRIAETLSDRISVDVVNVADAPTVIPSDTTLLVVGGPTHAFGMSRSKTRQSAREQGAEADAARGIREWLAEVEGVSGIPAFAFDTRTDQHFVPGRAARGASHRLARLGCLIVEAPVSFHVTGTEGPLVDGEEERAVEFAQMLLRDLERRHLLPGVA